MTPKPVLVGGCRTPFARSFGKFRGLTARQLAGRTTAELFLRLNLPHDVVDEVIFGNVAGPADAPNVTRVVATDVGIPESVPAMTVHRNCASAMEAVVLGSDRIRAGQSRCVLAGGVESMSRVPFLFGDTAQNWFTDLSRSRTLAARLKLLLRLKPKFFKPIPGLMKGLVDPSCGLSMGQTAEKLAKEFGISRKEQDEYSLRSHQRAISAREKLRDEIVELYAPPSFRAHLADDDGPRPDSSMERLARLRPVFDRRDGSVTAGNSSQITDGAVSLLLMDEARALELGLPALGVIRAHVAVGLDPSRMGLGPAMALAALLEREEMQLSEIELFEINEAFAAQVLAVAKALASDSFCQEHFSRSAIGELDLDRVNVNGGAIALGHPVGASGARIVHTLALEMQRRSARWGVATLCVGGGQGQAVLVERES